MHNFIEASKKENSELHQAGPKKPPTVPKEAIDAHPVLLAKSFNEAYLSISEPRKQRLLVKLLTDRLTRPQLISRGFETVDSCRRGCPEIESLSHFVGVHVFPEIHCDLPKGIKRNFLALAKKESFSKLEPKVAALMASTMKPSDNLTPMKKRRRIDHFEPP